MLKQTSPIILSEATESKKARILAQPSIFQKGANKQQNMDTVNTIKIDFNHMSKMKINCSQYTQCECGAILTIDDKVSQYEKEEQMVLWDCRYCKKTNRSKEIYYCANGAKILLEKNSKVQRGFLPPILLFVIDLSGSMEQSISVEFDDSSKKESNLITASKQILQIIKNCTFQQKQQYKQAQLKYNYRFDEQKQTFKNSKMKGTNYFSKISFFMGIIENYLQKIKSHPKYSQFRIGFVFFNETIYILKPTKQKMIPVFVSKTSNFNKDYPFEKNVTDFNSFEAMFNAGKKFQRFFGDSRFKNCDLSKLMVQNLETQGQTAFGPALALALGISSVHDIGSRIILISDSDPNIGILSQQTYKMNTEIYKEISKFLQLRKTTIGVLNWITQNSKSYQERMESQFGQFVSSNKEHVVEITLDFSLRQSYIDVLTTARNTLQGLINRGSLGDVISVKMLTSCPRVQVNKLQYDEINFRSIKFLGLQRKTWVQFKLKKFLEEDFLFPVYTQIVVTYQDVLTKQKYLFMSYVKHKIISVSQEKEVYEYLEESNRNNIKELMDLQKLFTFDRQNIIPESEASRNFQYISLKMQNKSDTSSETLQFCESLNSLAQLQNRRNEDNEQQYL